MPRTRATIKQSMKALPEILSVSRDRFFTVKGRSREQYTVTRTWSGDEFLCTCPGAKKWGLCRHVQSVVVQLASALGWESVAFWFSEQDARRQKKRFLKMYAHGKPFWVTYSWGAWVPRESGAHVVKVKQNVLNAELWDVHYRTSDGRTYRHAIRRAA